MSDRLVGRVVANRWRIASFIREGGMAGIYHATQSAEPRNAALKIMHAELARDPRFVRRFRREARAASRLRHPNVVEIYEYGDDKDIVYIAMELVRGNDLLVPLARDGAFSEARAARIIVQVCDALTAAHAQNVVHRDLKPENVMLVADPRDQTKELVKVLDFGIAKILDDQGDAKVLDPRRETPTAVRSMLTRVGMIVGTPAYMSPEQGRAEPIDLRTDIYSCGVLLYELLTGVPPFEGETPMQVVMKHVNEAPRPPSVHLSIHGGLEAIIMKALKKWPKDRHQSAAELKAEIEKILPELGEAPGFGARANGKPAAAGERSDSMATTVVKEPKDQAATEPVARKPESAPPDPDPIDDDDDQATFVKAPPDSVRNPNPGLPTQEFGLEDMVRDGSPHRAPTASRVDDSPAPPPAAPTAPAGTAAAANVTSNVEPAPAVDPRASLASLDFGVDESLSQPAAPQKSNGGAPAAASSQTTTDKMRRPDPASLRPESVVNEPSTAGSRSPEPGALGAQNAPPPADVSAASPQAGGAPPDFYGDPRTKRLITIVIALGVALLLVLVALLAVIVVFLTRQPV